MSPTTSWMSPARTYQHFLINGPAGRRPIDGLFKPGRSAFGAAVHINGSLDETHDVRIPGLFLNVVAADRGADVDTVTVEAFRNRRGRKLRRDVVEPGRRIRAYAIFRPGAGPGTAMRVGEPWRRAPGSRRPSPDGPPAADGDAADTGYGGMAGMEGMPGMKRVRRRRWRPLLAGGTDMGGRRAQGAKIGDGRPVAPEAPIVVQADGVDGEVLPRKSPGRTTSPWPTQKPPSNQGRGRAGMTPIAASGSTRSDRPGAGRADRPPRRRGRRDNRVTPHGNMQRWNMGLRRQEISPPEPIATSKPRRGGVRFVLVNDTIWKHRPSERLPVFPGRKTARRDGLPLKAYGQM